MSISLSTGHSYSCQNPEETIEKIIQQEQLDYQAEMRQMELEDFPFIEELRKDDLYWEKQHQKYLKVEEWIRSNNDKIPTWEVAGSLHYGMSLGQMQDVIKQKFRDMASSGHMLREQSIDRTTCHPTTGRGKTDLIRIWGAQYLNSNLNDPTLKAADHFLVVDDDAAEIEVEVAISPQCDYPCLSTVKNAHILSKKIEGERRAGDYQHSASLDRLKYRDFVDLGNIICDSANIGWIVDTEMKSFDPPTIKSSTLQNYLRKRFKILYGEELVKVFKIPLSNVGIQ